MSFDIFCKQLCGSFITLGAAITTLTSTSLKIYSATIKPIPSADLTNKLADFNKKCAEYTEDMARYTVGKYDDAEVDDLPRNEFENR